MSKWTQKQQQKAADYIQTAYPDGTGLRGMGISLVDLACQRNELLEALKTLIDVCDGNYRELTDEMRLLCDRVEGK